MSAAVLTLSFPQSSVRDAVCPCPCPCSAAALAAGRAQAGEGGAVGPRRLRESSAGLRPGRNLGEGGCRGRLLSTPRGRGPGQG